MRALPYTTNKCYACDAEACGVRDRRPEGGALEAACARHRDPQLRAFAACFLCLGPRPTLLIDQDFAHKKCHQEACR